MHPSDGRSSRIVLIVDDDVHVRDGLCAVLESEGYAVATADDGREALEFIAGGVSPAVILLDLEMPRLDGEDFCRTLARDPVGASIPVVVVSGRAHSKAPLEGRVVEQLGKPIDVSRLLDVVAEAAALGPSTARTLRRSR